MWKKQKIKEAFELREERNVCRKDGFNTLFCEKPQGWHPGLHPSRPYRTFAIFSDPEFTLYTH